MCLPTPRSGLKVWLFPAQKIWIKGVFLPQIPRLEVDPPTSNEAKIPHGCALFFWVLVNSRCCQVDNQAQSTLRTLATLCRSPGFVFQYPHGGSQLTVALVLEDVTVFSGLWAQPHSHVHAAPYVYTELNTTNHSVKNEKMLGCYHTPVRNSFNSNLIRVFIVNGCWILSSTFFFYNLLKWYCTYFSLLSVNVINYNSRSSNFQHHKLSSLALLW